MVLPVGYKPHPAIGTGARRARAGMLRRLVRMIRRRWSWLRIAPEASTTCHARTSTRPAVNGR